MTQPMIWLIMLPLIAAIVTFLTAGRGVKVLGIATSLGTAALAAWLTWDVWTDETQRYALGGWDAPLGIGLRADGLSVLLIGMTAMIGVMVSIYATDFFDIESPHQGTDRGAWLPDQSFWPLWLFLWAALNALFLSNDLFNLYVGLELVTLASVGLTVLERHHGALTAGLRYLLAAFLGSMGYLLGVALLYGATGTLDIDLIAERISFNLTTYAALGLVITGLLMKSALFPLHFWLPRAHGSAPAPVSAILSALVAKAAFYLILRIWFDIYQGASTVPIEQLIGVFGALAIVGASIQAIRQERLKLMIAYSTVAQIGYFFLVIPLAGSWGTGLGIEPAWRFEAWSGGLYLLLAHGFAKSAMFLAAGFIMHSYGHDRVQDLTGAAVRFPLVFLSFGIAGLSLIGLPPSGGFVGKWLLLGSAIASGQWWWVAIILIGGLLTAGYVVIVLSQSLSNSEVGDVQEEIPRRRLMEYSIFILAGISLLLGIRATEPLELLEIGSPLPLTEEAGGER